MSRGKAGIIAPCGTNARYKSGCRCQRCRGACADAAREYRRRKNISTPCVNAQRARNHILAMQSAGIGRRNISLTTGLSTSTIATIRDGKRPVILRSTHDRIMGVTTDDVSLMSNVPAWPVRRFVSEMNRAGIDDRHISAALKTDVKQLHKLLCRESVQRRTVMRLRVLYELLTRQGIVPASVLMEVA